MKKLYSVLLIAVFALTAGGLFFAQEKEQSERDADLAPHGKGIGTMYRRGDPGTHFGANRAAGFTRTGGNGINYHNGPVMLGTVNIYLIWYGNWSHDIDATNIIERLSQNIGGTPYLHINSTYYSGSTSKQHVSGNTNYVGAYFDSYSQGSSLSDANIQTIVSSAINSGGLNKDTNGVYFVLTSTDVTETSGFCTNYCGWHSAGIISGSNIKYAFIGNPDQCPSACEAQATSPNGNAGADGMASIVSHELEESISDPNGNAWYDSRGEENADKCAWTFGKLSTASNGSKYNMVIGGTSFLIQQNWVNAGGGHCAVSY